MLTLVQQLINFGVDEKTIMLILMLPVIATVIAFFRHIIGIQGFGIYTSLILSFAFVETGLEYGLIIFFLVLLAGTLARVLISKLRLAYLPRMASVLIFVTIAVLGLYFVVGYLHIATTAFFGISIFPILMMIILMEKFVAVQTHKGWPMAILTTIETIFLAVVSFFIVNWQWFQGIVFSHPITVILVALIVNILVGRWTGLRLSEYFRFRNILNYVQPPKKR